MLVRALLLDFDGLVVDTEIGTYESWREIYEAHGAVLSLQAWADVVGSGSSTGGSGFDAVRELEQLTGRRLNRDALIEQRSRRKEELCELAALRPGVRELLAQARQRELSVGLVTRARGDWVERHLRRVDLDHPWDVLVSGGDSAPLQPKADLYRSALAWLALGPAEAIAFEDSPHGVAAAREAGLFTVAVPSDVTRGAAFEADLVVDTLLEIRLDDLIERMSG